MNDSLAKDLEGEKERDQIQNQETVSPHTEPTVIEGEKQEEKVEQIDYKDLFLRVSADLQNFQRRIEKQKLEWTSLAQEIILLKLLPLIEDLDRALVVNISSDQPEINQWIEGLSVVQKNLKKALNEIGVEEIVTVGLFNPEFHEAIAQVDSAKHQSGEIVDVVGKGYKLKDKVIKYAQVTVAK